MRIAWFVLPLWRRALFRSILCGSCLLLALQSSGCAAGHQKPVASLPPLPAPTPADMRIYAAVMDYLGSGVLKPCTEFVSIRGQDPPEAFFRGLAGYPCKLERGSRFRQGRGLLTSLGAIRRTDQSLVEVEVSNFRDRYSALGLLVILECKEDRWQGREIRVTWMS